MGTCSSHGSGGRGEAGAPSSGRRHAHTLDAPDKWKYEGKRKNRASGRGGEGGGGEGRLRKREYTTACSSANSM